MLFVGGFVLKAYTCRVHYVDEHQRPAEISPVYEDTITEPTPQPEDDMWVHTYIITCLEPLIYDRENQKSET